MKTIFKYPISATHECLIDLPKGAKIISLKVQRGIPCLWAIVDTDAEIEKRKFMTYGTGHELPVNPGTFIGTFLVNDFFVYHVFEVIS